ncbi:MAG: DUF1707 domain-containing protein [Spirochaetales bacterium]|nr:DUF1707 domain-containing protein [Spirochaetales bacterium]
MQEKRLVAIGLPQRREETSRILSECFTRDLLDMDEYEKRIELVHSATTLAEFEQLIADVPENIIKQMNNEVAPDSSGHNRIVVNSGIERISG